MKNIFCSLLLLVSLSAFSQNKPAYQLFDAKGKKTTYKKMLKASENSELVLFGEFHDNPISHWLQLSLTKDLHKTNKLILGTEMIERDNQIQLNQYLSGEINQKALDTLARLWNNYKTD